MNNNEKKIIFACGTEFHLLIAFVISNVCYVGFPKILYLHNNSRVLRYYNSAKELGLWDSVILIDDDPSSEIDAPFLKSEIILHFFSWGFPYLNALFKKVADRSGNKIILTDEGLLTYAPFRAFETWVSVDSSRLEVAKGFSLERIDEIWLLDPDLYVDTIGAVLKKIPFLDFMSAACANPYLVNNLKTLFNVTNEIHPNGKRVFYFQQYGFQAGLLGYHMDEFIDETIRAAFDDSSLFVKKHPALMSVETADLFFLEVLPWELNLILSKLMNFDLLNQKSVLISLSSSSLHNTITIFGAGTYVYLYKIMGGYGGRADSVVLDAIIDNLRIKYPDASIYVPNDWSEFSSCLKKECLNVNLFGSNDVPSVEVEIKRIIEKLELNEVRLNQVMVDRENHVIQLSQTVAERDGQLAQNNQAMVGRGNQVDLLSKAISDRDLEINNILSSRSWRLTKPFRWARRLLRGDFSAVLTPFQLKFGLKRDEMQPVTAQIEPMDSSVIDIIVSAPIAITHHVSVILPVYRGVDMTRRCIEAAMQGVLEIDDAILLAINDASPDEGMQDMLESMARTWPERFIVLSNSKNMGFVQTVNRGMEHFFSRDVVLLNSDVIVPFGWLRRLQREAYSHPKVATVTPLTNNGEICSFPNFLKDNSSPFNLNVWEVDEVFQLSCMPCIKAPTGVGFCMYIRRTCIDQIGLLDAEKFGRGYGEENDLCQRAIKAGWINIISPNMYCFHEGGVSFSSDKQLLVERAMRVIDTLHPNYHTDVRDFIKRDPLRIARVERYLKLIAKLPLPKVLHVSHGLGGGVVQHINELSVHFKESLVHMVLSPDNNESVVSLMLRHDSSSDSVKFKIKEDYDRLKHLLNEVGISAVHFHHCLNLDPIFSNLAKDLNATSIITIHDFYLLNANPTLTDKDGIFSGKYYDDLHNPLYPLPAGITPPQWRQKWRALIESADCVIFPSNSTRVLFGDMFQFKRVVIAAHPEPFLDIRRDPDKFTKKPNYVIGVLGAIGKEKGADFLEKIAEMAKAQNARFSFKLIGYAYRSLNAVETTGPYKQEDLIDLIKKNLIDVIFFPARWPETYSYTLSNALASGLPIIAPNIGAFPERLASRDNTLIIDHLSSVEKFYQQIDAFVGKLECGDMVLSPPFNDNIIDERFYDDGYLKLVESNIKKPLNERYMFDLDELVVERRGLNLSGWRYRLLNLLYVLNNSIALRRVGALLPYGFKRKIKRALSREPIHNVLERSKK